MMITLEISWYGFADLDQSWSTIYLHIAISEASFEVTDKFGTI